MRPKTARVKIKRRLGSGLRSQDTPRGFRDLRERANKDSASGEESMGEPKKILWTGGRPRRQASPDPPDPDRLGESDSAHPLLQEITR